MTVIKHKYTAIHYIRCGQLNSSSTLLVASTSGKYCSYIHSCLYYPTHVWCVCRKYRIYLSLPRVTRICLSRGGLLSLSKAIEGGKVRPEALWGFARALASPKGNIEGLVSQLAGSNIMLFTHSTFYYSELGIPLTRDLWLDRYLMQMLESDWSK